MNQKPRQAAPHPTRFALIQSNWHADIIGKGCESFLVEMAELGVPRQRIDSYNVPGAYELPLHAKRLARCGRYGGIVACGLVVDGGIYRHDFVANAVIQGLMQVQLETDIPVFSMVLTPHHFHEHREHQEFFLRHFITKGKEAAHACIGTVDRLNVLP